MVTALWLTVACTGDLSNAIFIEDALFLGALPTSDRFQLEPPGTAPLAADAASLFAYSRDALAGAEDLMGRVTAVGDEVAALPPSERGPDFRVWGPFEWDDVPGTWVRAELGRSSTGSTYSLSVQVGPTSAGPWDGEWITGVHTAGPVEVPAGTGWVAYDHAALVPDAGTVWAEYDIRDLTRLLVVATDTSDDGAWLYQQLEDGGDLQHVPAAPPLADGDLLALRTRWRTGGEGRGDARLARGDDSVAASQCWASDGALVWQWDEAGWLEPLGEEVACAVQGFAEVDASLAEGLAGR